MESCQIVIDLRQSCFAPIVTAGIGAGRCGAGETKPSSYFGSKFNTINIFLFLKIKKKMDLNLNEDQNRETVSFAPEISEFYKTEYFTENETGDGIANPTGNSFFQFDQDPH